MRQGTTCHGDTQGTQGVLTDLQPRLLHRQTRNHQCFQMLPGADDVHIADREAPTKKEAAIATIDEKKTRSQRYPITNLQINHADH